jgi:hypothetical protein
MAKKTNLGITLTRWQKAVGILWCLSGVFFGLYGIYKRDIGMSALGLCVLLLAVNFLQTMVLEQVDREIGKLKEGK